MIDLKKTYPKLKDSEHFRNLTQQLTSIENDIANARKYYNRFVRIMNDKVEIFLSNIVAHIFGFKTYKMFEAKEFERDNVKVEL